jgi:hypothetical protein
LQGTYAQSGGVSKPWSHPKKLDMHSHRIDLKSFNTWQKLLDDNFIWRKLGGTEIKFGYEAIPYDKLIDKLFKVKYDSDIEMKVIRIYYGVRADVENGYRFILIYSPALAKWARPTPTRPVDPHGSDTYTLEPKDDNENEKKYFILSNDRKDLVEVGYNDVNTWRTAYRNTILINRNNTGNDSDFKSFNHANDSSGDAQGEVITFNEIDKFYHKGTVYFTSMAKADYQNGVSFLKHFIGLSNLPPNDPSRKNIAANLGTLCPPGCDGFKVHAGLTYPSGLAAIIASLPLAIQAIVGFFSLIGMALGIRWGARKARMLFKKEP